MRRHRSPLIPVVLAVTALALFVSACGKATPPALTVNGWELSRSTFLDQLDEIASNKQLVALLGVQPYTSSDDNSYSTQFTADLLNLHLENQLLVDEVGRRGLQVDTAAAEQELVSQIAGASSGSSSSQTQPTAAQTAQAQALLDGAGWMKDALITNRAYSVAIQGDLDVPAVSEDQMRATYDKAKDQISQACVSHILIIAGSGERDPQTGKMTPGTDAEYAAALTEIEGIKRQLDAGGDFAASAKTSSKDTGSAPQGGDLGCQPKGSYVTEFDDAVWSLPVGQVSDPVKTQYGYHLVLVTKRDVPTFEQVRPQIEQALTQQDRQDAYRAWLTDAMKGADVTVDGRFGEWQADQGQIAPPAGAELPSTTTTLPDAIQGLVPGGGDTATSEAPTTAP